MTATPQDNKTVDWETRLDNESHEGKSISLWQHVAAGSVAGAVEHTITYPFDALSTRSHYKKLHPNQPLPSLFKGMGTAVLGSIPAHAAMFTSFEKVRARLDLHPSPMISKLAEPIAGALSVLTHDIFDTPTTIIKRRLQTGTARGQSVTQSKDYYRDLALSLAMKIPENLVQNTATPYFMKKLNVENIMEVEEEEAKRIKTFAGLPVKGLLLHFTAHGLGGALSAALCTPFDVIRTHQTCGLGHASQSKGLLCTGRSIYQQHGVRGLFSGIAPRAVGAFPEAALSWGTFELIEHMMKRIKTKAS